MKRASHNLSDEYFVLKMDGHIRSAHRRFIDALKAGLELRINFQRTTSKCERLWNKRLLYTN
jgi:hypothetical protein